MATTDTVVGIVGAVLLAGVMVAVFVYEYNNPPAATGDGDLEAARHAAFAANHPLLNATEDLDHDGLPNYEDADMDGDGMNDTQQPGDLVIRVDLSGGSSGPGPMAYSAAFPVPILTGNQGVRGWLNWTPLNPGQLPAGLPVPLAPDFTCRLAAGGDTVDCGPATAAASGQRSRALDAPAQAAGNATFSVQEAVTGPATSYSITLLLDYGRAQPPRDDTAAVPK